MNKLTTIFFISMALMQASLAAPLESAFERMNQFDRLHWSYQRVTKAEDNRVENYDPVQEPKWTLLELNGKTPSEQEQKSYLSEKRKQAKENADKDSKLNLHEMIDVESLQLAETGTDTDRYTFQPIIRNGDFAKHLTGQLWHNKQGDFIERFEFQNTDEFSPMMGVKIKKMHTSFQFKKISEGIYAPDQITSEVLGRAFGLKQIDDKESQTYQSFKAVAQ